MISGRMQIITMKAEKAALYEADKEHFPRKDISNSSRERRRYDQRRTTVQVQFFWNHLKISLPSSVQTSLYITGHNKLGCGGARYPWYVI